MINQYYDAPILLIDSSYASFYRFYAIQLWYGFSNKEEMEEIKLSDDYDWTKNDIFMNKYEQKYMSVFDKIRKRYEIPTCNMIFAIDCPRDSIWRMKHYSSYKSNRNTEKHRKHNIKEVLKITYSEIIPKLIEKYSVKSVKVDHAEADDVAAIIKNEIRRIQPNRKIIIVTGDLDYLQLSDSNTELINIKGESLLKKSKGSPEKDLLTKIIGGDNSDYIPAIFNKCGPKTTERLVNNEELLNERLLQDENARKKYELNKLLVDFNSIPTDIQKKIVLKLYSLDIIPIELKKIYFHDNGLMDCKDIITKVKVNGNGNGNGNGNDINKNIGIMKYFSVN